MSSVVGLTVLDIIRDEGLQENARQVGATYGRTWRRSLTSTPSSAPFTDRDSTWGSDSSSTGRPWSRQHACRVGPFVVGPVMASGTLAFVTT